MTEYNVKIIYDDDDILVINKPSGISVTADRTGLPQLSDILPNLLGDHPARQLRLVHRLDKLTSGVMILAKHLKAQSQFSSYFENRLIRKTYLAIVRPTSPPPHEGIINISISQCKKKPSMMCTTYKKGKKAITHWKLLADFGATALLEVIPTTGRTHQIRVHLQSTSLPLAIDPLYGTSRGLYLSDFKVNYRLAKGKIEKPLIQRLTLHAYQLRLQNPLPNKPEIFVAECDKDFTTTIKMLTKHNLKGGKAFINPDNLSIILNAQPL